MENQSTRLVRSIRDPIQLADFIQRLAEWLIKELNRGYERVPAFTESRARALLRVTEVIDDPTLGDFDRLMADEGAARLALHDLLHESGLSESAEAVGLATASAAATSAPATLPWLPLAVAAYAWKRGFPLHQLDPASPPDGFSPAGILLKDTAQFIRQQVQRSPTERDRLRRQLAFSGHILHTESTTLDTMPHVDTPVVPAPSVYRPPIPVRYPEVARDVLHVQPPTDQETPPPVTRGEPLVITDEDVRQAAPPAPLRVDPPPPAPTPPSPLPPSAVIMPNSATSRRPSLSVGQRRAAGSQARSTKLRVLVQQVADGPGLYGVQVRVSCRRVRAEVAGTTNRDGHFLCELPVKETEGLTYQVEVTWPQDLGGNIERKAITLNADRTEFTLPFYRQYQA
ncbi:MAG: hypothetical protein KC418_10050 [Anaerolineales bacterium]|nr:hypothetical protein [Anaerolineales bacterium]MCB8952189.1 hypothetical protein [Ardenticatenales bacterium]